jgi:phenylacetate-coenzyme A ligase PaaK-like adenylate-forming protein
MAVHKDLTNSEYVRWLNFLGEADQWSLEQIREYESEEMRRIISFAYENTAGYREHFDRFGIKPSDIQNVEDFGKLPFITKDEIRDQLENFSSQIQGRFYITTGGSTGIPAGMYRDPVSFAKELASKAHQYHRVGWREGDRQIVFRGLQIDTPDNIELAQEFNELRCSTYQFGTARMETYRQRAYDYMPDWIRCYPSSGYVFAQYLKESGKPFPKIKGMLCSSEQLFDFQRNLFQEVFGDDIKIFAHYGHYEMAALAGFCEYTQDYHVLPQYGFVELLDRNDDPVTIPSTVGEIVATSFIMHATPFIRYRTQDLAVFKSNGCDKCGRPYQIWERIEGRLQELVMTKTGRLISTSMLNMHDDTYDNLKQFQFHQREPGSVIFRFIPKPGLDAAAAGVVKQKLQRKLGDDIEMVMEPVDDIPLTKRGKHRLLIQELDLELDHPALSKAITL